MAPLLYLRLPRLTCQDRPLRRRCNSRLCAERLSQWVGHRSRSKGHHSERHNEHRADSTRCKGQWALEWIERDRQRLPCLWTVPRSQCSPACRSSQKHHRQRCPKQCLKGRCSQQRNRLCSGHRRKRQSHSRLRSPRTFPRHSKQLLTLQA